MRNSEEGGEIKWFIVSLEILRSLLCYTSMFYLKVSSSSALSFEFSHSVLSDSVIPRTAAHQASLSITKSQSLLKLRLLSWWCHPSISFSVGPFFSCLQSFQASGSFQMCRFFISGGQSIGVSASASVLPLNIQDWFPLGWTRWISFLSKGFSRVFSNTTVQKHYFSSAQLSL